MELAIDSKIALNDGHRILQLGLGVRQTRAGKTCEAGVLAVLEAKVLAHRCGGRLRYLKERGRRDPSKRRSSRKHFCHYQIVE